MKLHDDTAGDEAPRLEEPLEYRKEIAEHPAAALNLVARVVEDWGGLWQPEDGHTARMGLPVSAGLRRGWLAGPITATRLEGKPPEDGNPDDEMTLLVFRAEVGEYKVDRAAVMVLSIAGAAGLLAMVAPFFPALLGFLPLAMILGLAAWLMVIARLRNSGPDELLDALESEPPGSGDPAIREDAETPDRATDD